MLPQHTTAQPHHVTSHRTPQHSTPAGVVHCLCSQEVDLLFIHRVQELQLLLDRASTRLGPAGEWGSRWQQQQHQQEQQQVLLLRLWCVLCWWGWKWGLVFQSVGSGDPTARSWSLLGAHPNPAPAGQATPFQPCSVALSWSAATPAPWTDLCTAAAACCTMDSTSRGSTVSLSVAAAAAPAARGEITSLDDLLLQLKVLPHPLACCTR